jgi:hypothetical protein
MLVSFRLEIVLTLTQVRCTGCVECTIGSENHCWMHPMDLLGDVGHVECHLSGFGDSVSLSAR